MVDEFTSSYVEKFLEMCKHKHIKYIIPTREGDLIFFERYKNIFDGSEIQIMLADDIDRFSDKLIFYRRYENELNVIPTYVNFDEIPSGKRYVVKERFGSGSKNLFVDITKDEVEAAVRLLQNPVIQPYIVGDEYSLDGYCDQHGCPVGLVIRKRSYVVNGESKVTIVVESSSELYSTLIDVISRLRIQYHFVLQFIVDRHGKVHIMECNARYGGASSVALFVGLKSFHWYLGGMNFNINKRVFTPDRSVTQVRHESNLHLW